jgi:hypothetical protein
LFIGSAAYPFTPNDTLMNDEVILEDKFFIAYYAMNFRLERNCPPDAHFMKKKFEVFLPVIV